MGPQGPGIMVAGAVPSYFQVDILTDDTDIVALTTPQPGSYVVMFGVREVEALGFFDCYIHGGGSEQHIAEFPPGDTLNATATVFVSGVTADNPTISLRCWSPLGVPSLMEGTSLVAIHVGD